MDRLQNHMSWAVIASQTTHLFCCGLPVLVSLTSLLSGFGLIGILPPSMSGMHEILHEWEMPILMVSGIILFLGWGLQAYSYKLDCTKTVCAHAPCGAKKKKSVYVLIGATLLFVLNISIYIFSGH